MASRILNLCRAISKFNFHFRNKLVSLEIRQAKERRRGDAGRERQHRRRVSSLLSPRHEGEQNTIAAHFDRMRRRGQLQFLYSALIGLLWGRGIQFIDSIEAEPIMN